MRSRSYIDVRWRKGKGIVLCRIDLSAQHRTRTEHDPQNDKNDTPCTHKHNTITHQITEGSGQNGSGPPGRTTTLAHTLCHDNQLNLLKARGKIADDLFESIDDLRRQFFLARYVGKQIRILDAHGFQKRLLEAAHGFYGKWIDKAVRACEDRNDLLFDW